MTDFMPTEPSNEPIVITKDDANSRHVDDLIKRQMSLRGEGITAEPQRRWYYQNWLLFMVIGAIAAACAWLLLEPSFADFLSTQGPIEAINVEDVLSPPRSGNEFEPVQIFGQGSLTIRGQKVWLFPNAQEVKDEKAVQLLDASTLRVGQEVRVFTKFYGGGREGNIHIAHYVDPHPAPLKKAPSTLSDQSSASEIAGFLLFSTVAGLIGLGIGAADGISCRLPRRAIIGGLVGLLVGAVGGLLTNVIANVLYVPLNNVASVQLASESSAARAFGFLLQMIARMFAWSLAGMAMGLGQGIALRSRRLLAYGFLGGVIGGLLGGLLFDPLDMVILGSDRVGAEISRAVGFIVIGAAVGAMIGIVELMTRDAWLRMTEGPLAGKEFLIFRDTMNIGASPKSEIYLFNDERVAPTHATIRMIGDETEITARDRVHPLVVNQNPVRNARLRHGDRITIGSTSFVFEQRQR